MKNSIITYNRFFSSQVLKWILYMVCPATIGLSFLITQNPIFTVLFIIIYLTLEYMTAYMNLGGIFDKTVNNREYIKSSPYCQKIIKSITLVDFLRRFITTAFISFVILTIYTERFSIIGPFMITAFALAVGEIITYMAYIKSRADKYLPFVYIGIIFIALYLVLYWFIGPKVLLLFATLLLFVAAIIVKFTLVNKKLGEMYYEN